MIGLRSCAWQAITGLVLGLTIAGCAPATPITPMPLQVGPHPNHAVERLLQAQVRRLELMHDVARWKWNQGQAIEDPAREEALLQVILPQCEAAGLDMDFARPFFRAQIEAAKQVQEEDFQAWKAVNQGPFADGPDLTTQLRPQIDASTQELVAALARAAPQLATDADRTVLGLRARSLSIERSLSLRAISTACQPLLPEKAATGH
jgi:chorismate mutase